MTSESDNGTPQLEIQGVTTHDLPRISPLGIGEFEEGDEVLVPYSWVKPARGGRGKQFKAARVEIKEFVEVDEGTHKWSEGV